MATNIAELDQEKDVAALEKESEPRGPETIADLESVSGQLKQDLEKTFRQDSLDIAALEKAAGPEAAPAVAASQELEKTAAELKEEARIRLDAVLAASQAAFESLSPEEKKQLHTTYQEIPAEVATDRLKKIPPEMQGALKVCGEVFQDCEYPWAMIGSNALVLEAETEKLGDDLDIIFAIQDFDQVYEKLEALEQAGTVEHLKVTEMKNLAGQANGCFKLSGQMKSGERLIDFEAFGQNIDPEKNKNGLVNIGLDEHQVNVYQIPDAKGETAAVNMMDKAGVEKLYFQNLLNEFGLYDLEGWNNRGFLNSKAIQRIANLQNLGNSPEKIVGALPEVGVKTEKAEQAKEVISHLWEGIKGGEYKGPGLTRTLGEKLNLPDNRYRPEKVVDFITKETGAQMKSISEIGKQAEAMEKAAENSLDPKALAEYDGFLKAKIGEVAAIRDRYQEYLGMTSSQDAEADFAPYAALIRLKDYFAQPALADLVVRKIRTEEKLLALEN